MSTETISPATLKSWLDAGEATLIDVREPAEFRSGHIPGARSVPLATTCCAALPPDGKKLVLQCKAGRRGGTACEKLLAEEPSRTLYNLEGGLDGWIAAGFPIERSGKAILPLDRQVQLTIGLVLLGTSVVAHAFNHVGGYWLTGLVGCGLSFAGLTGFCGLARLLARAPWNR